MDKLSYDQLQQVLEVVPGTLRSLAAERDHWRKEAQARMQHEEAEKVARAMHDKGINVDTPIGTLIENLEKAAAAGKLEKIAEAVDMVGPDMGQKIASLAGDSSTAASGLSSTEFERYLVGGVG
jgi:hypothetical protein